MKIDNQVWLFEDDGIQIYEKNGKQNWFELIDFKQEYWDKMTAKTEYEYQSDYGILFAFHL